ncbi:hypothetical protein AAA799P11_00767 [Marine Group I thaumarchaeote SCGC AAA799-P11]|uniref:Uncharacterized protein n=1 Tax=Marine Group I thaumarchaeote SCGC AAA799-P11 TaxID=1502295 RepID=A0A087S139_9ARCH|nr:hypothetical protein AAA799P11_00767 [Marine Group I thaumarchaeote SCGC AAA799-P11]
MSQAEPTLMMYERERILLEYIKENPSLHHNALLKLVVPKFMAKTTFEKTRDSLIDKEIIYTNTEKNMKFYHVTENYARKAAQHIEQTTNNSFHDLKIQIKRLETDFPHKDIDEKIHTSNSLLHRLLQTDNGFTILDSIKNPKKTLYRDEHLTIQQLIFQVYETIQNDKDSELLIPTITSFLGVIVPKNSLEK